MEKKKIHLICNAHIDPIWQWEWQEGVSATLSTFKSAADLAEEFDYIFCHNEVTVYKYVEEYAPELFERIKSLVKRGKWRIMGGWYLQPDCNMPSGESFVRQIREGHEYFKEKFGVVPEVSINFDSFGHTRGLVQILKKCGQKGYICCRPYASEKALPEDGFLWVGLDGSEIKAIRAIDGYNTPMGMAEAIIKDRAKRHKGNTALVLWGVGNHGGGPSRKDLIDVTEMIKNGGEYEYIHSYPEKFFDEVNPTERVEESLRISMPGCYTSMRSVKRKHAELEKELYFAEKIASVASIKGLCEYPEEKLKEITQDLLNAEFHDTLPGSCVRSGEENALNLLSHGLLEAERIKTKAFFSLLRTQSSAKDGEFPVFVFNPQPYELRTEVECEFMLADQNWSEEIFVPVVEDENGSRLPVQMLKEESNINLDWRKKIIFSCTLKPMDITRFSVYIHREKLYKSKSKCFCCEENGIKTEIDKNTGLLIYFGTETLNYVRNAGLLYCFDDNEDPWAMQGFQQKRLGENGKPFVLSSVPHGVFKGMKPVQAVENGDVIFSVESFYEYKDSKARLCWTVNKLNGYVDLSVDLFPGEINAFTKLAVPLNFEGKLFGQTAFGSEELFTDARENVSGRFIMIKGKEKSLIVMNDGVYGSHFEDGTLYLSLHRGVSYCAHPILDKPIIPHDGFVKKVDQGERNYRFRFVIANENEAERLTQEFFSPPYAVNAFPLGECMKSNPFEVAVSDPNVTLVALKKCRGETYGYVFRLLNGSEKPATAEIKVNGEKLCLNFNCYEVKTILLQNGKLKEIYELII